MSALPIRIEADTTSNVYGFQWGPPPGATVIMTSVVVSNPTSSPQQFTMGLAGSPAPTIVPTVTIQPHGIFVLDTAVPVAIGLLWAGSSVSMHIYISGVIVE